MSNIRESQNIEISSNGRKRKASFRDNNNNNSKKEPSSPPSLNIPDNQLKKKKFTFYLDLCLEDGMQIDFEDNNGKVITMEVEASDTSDDLKFNIKDKDRSSSKLDEYQDMRIFIEKPTGEKTALRVKASDKIENVKTMIHQNEGVPPDQQKLIFAGKDLENVKTISDYNIHMEPTLHLKEVMQIFIVNPFREVITMECEESDTIGKLKEMINKKEGISLLEQKLFLEGKQMENGRTLSEYNIQHESRIQLELRPYGNIEIIVEMPDGRRFPIDVNESDHPEKIEAKIFALEGIPPERQKLYYYERKEGCREILYGGIQLRDQAIEYGSIVMLEILGTRLPGQMQIHVKTWIGDQCEFFFDSFDTIKDVKRKIEEKRRTPIDEQRLMFDGRVLEDRRTLSYYNIIEGSVLNFFVVLPTHFYDNLINSLRNRVNEFK